MLCDRDFCPFGSPLCTQCLELCLKHLVPVDKYLLNEYVNEWMNIKIEWQY